MSCQIEARVLARSRGHHTGKEVVSFQLRYPRIIHAELMTHRAFSRNARSSRAVPVSRMIHEVLEAPFIPRYWGTNQKGMRAGEECSSEVAVGWGTDDYVYGSREAAWLGARNDAVKWAGAFAAAGYHKQVANRLLEPFTHIDVVLTTTNLSNWDALRDHEAAEPHIRDLAREMKRALADHGPATWLKHGDWHLPYVTAEERGTLAVKSCIGLSVARCARVSYAPFADEGRTVEEELARYEQLISARPMHASPCEHQCTPDLLADRYGWHNPGKSGNLGPGWIQYRKTLPGECA